MAFIRRWNLTGNGLEGLAEAHSDLPLVLDELGAATVGDIRPLIYQLAGGQGKTAMNSAREMREPRTWRTIAISTGEMSLHARMANPDDDGKRPRAIKGGLTHRALDVEVSDIAAAAPIEQREALVSGIKATCARHYGTAGPEFVQRLALRFATMAEARAHVRARVESVLLELAPAGLPTETRRALRRFALIAVAGELASDLDILPVSPGEIRHAARSLALAWLGTAAETDEERIIASVRAFILAHESRFQRIGEPDDDEPIIPYDRQSRVRRSDDPVRDRVGFVDRVGGLWYLTDAGLSEAAPGHDRTAIARVLKHAGYLHTNEPGKLKARASVEGLRPWLYAVKADILSADDSDLHKGVGQAGQAGHHQQPRGLEPVPVTETAPGQPGQLTGTDSPIGSVQTGGVPVGGVPPVPVGTRAPGQAQTQQPRGLVPAVPPVPPKNGVTGKNPPGEAGASDDDGGVIRV
ncbi:hypothetical protein CKO29_18145 [Allochromatium vinosum]|nr:hypothetical protein [Allochromatium vinosum]